MSDPTTPPSKRRTSRPIETFGVARALDGIRDAMVEAMRDWLAQQRQDGHLDASQALVGSLRAYLVAERENGRLEISEDVIETLARRAGRFAHETGQLPIEAIAVQAGKFARSVAADGIGEAWHLAINRTVQPDEHERDTVRVGAACPTCGAPLVAKPPTG